MNFEVHRHQTLISKANFYKLLGLSSSPDVVNPNSVVISCFISMFYQTGYNSDLSLLSKFEKSDLPFIWNALFTIFFKCLSERTVVWTQFTQSVNSNIKDSEISCAQFLSVVVCHALNNDKVPEIKDVVVIEILKMQTTTFVTSDPKNFNFICSIPEVMLDSVPLDNDIIKSYKEILNSGKPKQQRKPKYKQAVIDEDSNDQTHSNVIGEETFLNEDDIAHTSEVPLKTSELITTITTLKVSTLPASSDQTPHESDGYENISNEAIINFSQIQSPPLLKFIYEPQITLPFQILIFTNSIMNPSISQATLTTDTPPQVSIFELDKEYNRTSGIPENTSNMESNYNIGVTIFGTYIDFYSYFVSRIENDDDVGLSTPITRDKLKDLREVKTARKGNVSSASEKGKVNIALEEDDDMNPKLSEK
ncbi:unnamed protein product [Lactuca saligna]|uniref:Uncharacterized protein n=1 Tax=Lactuca saligna TaxID=75948 RepID=A0AA36A101_LACSI|nr:unnamed protein product [Lactuca saligna]